MVVFVLGFPESLTLSLCVCIDRLPTYLFLFCRKDIEGRGCWLVFFGLSLVEDNTLINIRTDDALASLT